MKKLIVNLTLLLVAVTLVYAATTTDVAIQATKNVGTSPYKSIMASNSEDVTAVKIGTLYGIAYSVEIVGVGDTDFTVTVYELPKNEAGGTITWPSASKITKFTKTISANGEYAFETTSINSNVAIGAVFTGDVYITVANFSGTAWYVNIPVQNERSEKEVQGGRY